MAAWGAWFGSLGAAVIDGGAPIGASTTAGGAASRRELTGYSILEADGLDAAAGMAGGCPIIADGGTVDVYETIDVGG